MKTTLIATALAASLAAGAAFAQTANDQKAAPPTGNQDSAQGKTQQINAQNGSNGNNLNARKAPERATADSDPQKSAQIRAQDAASGNNLSANQRAYTPYEQLDAQHSGRITEQQAKSDKWLASHFKACDANGDKTVTPQEYTACTKPK